MNGEILNAMVRIGAQYQAGFAFGDDEHDEVCGETYEHDLHVIGVDNGEPIYECRNCACEFWPKDDEL